MLMEAEERIRQSSAVDGRTPQELVLKCQQDIHVGVFFDGTNNNKFRDTPGFAQSNVARLYEVYPGTPAKQEAPTLKPKVLAGDKTSERPRFPDQVFESESIPKSDFSYYRKIYIPGNGTPMPNIADDGGFVDRTLGLAFAYKGEERLQWALLQLVNQVYAAVFGNPATPSIDLSSTTMRSVLKPPDPFTVVRYATEFINSPVERLLADLEMKLAKKLPLRGDSPHLRKIRLSVFGFSRGATLARAWVNLVNQHFGSSLSGIPLQIDFLGLFDSVASVGMGAAFPKLGKKPFLGRFSWGGPDQMVVPECVKRCVHLVAAHEVRASFAVDTVYRGTALPPNCKEIVYPGVHSDVGGGYAPGEQGRAAGSPETADACKISQIPLAQMYREARMAGVPLAPATAMKGRSVYFALDPKLREDFNAYVQATRTDTVAATEGKGRDAQFAALFPTETQPRDETGRIMWQHYAIMLRWRRDLLARPGGISRLPELGNAAEPLKYQDIEDLRGAEAELRLELNALERNRKGTSSKQHDWNTWLRQEWLDTDPEHLPAAATRLFEAYVHDSRAWFKPSLAENEHMWFAPNDEDWFTLGGREAWKKARTAYYERWSTRGHAKDRQDAQREIALLNQPGQPLIIGGREPWAEFGYLRHRTLYNSGTINPKSWDGRQKVLEDDENRRAEFESGKRQVANEYALHTKEMEKIEAAQRAKAAAGGLSDERAAEIRDAVARQKESELRRHQQRLDSIFKTTGATEKEAA